MDTDQPIVCAFRPRFNHLAEDVCERLVECSGLSLIDEHPLTSDAEDHTMRYFVPDNIKRARITVNVSKKYNLWFR